MAAKKTKVVNKYTKSARIHPCRLTRDDLVKLVEIIRRCVMPSSANDYFSHFSISTSLPGISIDADNIEEFLENEELPDKINELSIYYNARGPDKIYHIHLYFSKDFGSISVEGTDQTWVLGTHARIADFLKGKRPWFWFASTYMVFLFGSMIILPACLAGFILLVTSRAPIAYSTSVALLFIALGIAFYLHSKSKFMPHLQIILTTKKSFFDYNKAVVILMVASLIIAIIEAIRRH